MSGTASDDGLPAGSTLAVSWTKVSGAGTVTFSAPSAAVTTASFSAHGTYVLRLAATDSSLTTTDDVTVTVNPAGPSLPPDPVTVAPPLDRTVATTMLAATDFLYTGSNPIQTGVAPGTIQAHRAGVLRGNVKTRDGAPLSGVTITILNHPEFGQTLSRADGVFDMVVNGGGLLTVSYHRSGFLPVQRQIHVSWNDYVWLPQVVMIPFDSNLTSITANSGSIQVARGNVVTDVDGSRRATLLFPAGTNATMVLPNGSSQTLTSLQVRATEYTVGPSGPLAMPGALPAQSGYTYAVEYSVDEAVAADAKRVNFSQPVVHYSENFLGFPVGGIVPTGYYDRDKAAWMPSTNGRVIHILSIVDGQAVMDLDGSNQPASPGAYTALGITGAERQQLAGLYQPGQSLWRVPVTHFTPWDCNWPFGPPPGAQEPRRPSPKGGEKEGDPCETGGSVIECQNQTLRESVDLLGTRFSLHYSSDRVSGRSNRIEVSLSGNNQPPGLKRIELEVRVAGQLFAQTYTAAPNQTVIFTWDGKDVYNRAPQGAQPATVSIGYVYDGVYQQPSQAGQGFTAFSGLPITGSRTRQEITFWQHVQTRLGWIGSWDALAQALGGWTVSVNHAYDIGGKVLYLGDGRRRIAQDFSISSMTGTGNSGYSGDGGLATAARIDFPGGIALAPDGSLYIADTNNSRIRRVSPDGIITTVAGNGTPGYGGDGGAATLAKINFPVGVATGPDGSVYIADTDNSRIRKVAPDGIITTVAGTGATGYSGEAGPATQAKLFWPNDVAVAQDGSLYITDAVNNRIRRVSPDGIISTIAGTGTAGFNGDGGPASQARIGWCIGIRVGPDGSVYFSDNDFHRVRRIGPDGIISTIAGNGQSGYSGDGGLATLAALDAPAWLHATDDGTLYVGDSNRVVRRITTDGIIATVAGNGVPGYSGDGGPATQAQISYPAGIARGPDGSLYLADVFNNRIRRVSPVLPGFSPNDLVIPAEDGSELYVFDNQGRHLRTLHGLTNAVLYQFAYDTAGRLTTITDGDNNITTIQRAANGDPLGITGPYGQLTGLVLGLDGYLGAVTNPANEVYQFTYLAGGLLATMKDPKSQQYSFQYDSVGRLTRDDDPAGGFKALARTDASSSYEVTLSSPLTSLTRYNVERLATGDQRRTSTFLDGTTTVELMRTDGSRHLTYSEGDIASQMEGPDPRWGMQAPILKTETLTLPRGLLSTVTRFRSTTLANPADLLSLSSQTDTVVINSRTYTSVFNASNRTFTNTTPVGRQSTVTLNPLGRVSQSQIATLFPIVFGYDGRGRLSTTTEASGVDARNTAFAYNANGYLETITDPLSRVMSFQYDLVGRVTQQTLPGNRIINFNYDANGNLTSLTPPGKPQHSFDYTPVDLMNEYDPPTATNVGMRVSTYTYDTERKPALITRPDGQTIDFDYDTAGRLSALNLAGRQLTHAYHTTTGNLASITDSTGSSLAYSYDGSLPKSVTWSGPVSGSVVWDYDNSLRFTSRSINEGNSISFGYDNDSLLTSAGILALTRNPQTGLLTGTTLGNVTDSWIYNNFAETTGYSASVSGTPVYSAAYTRDKLSRITTKAEAIQGVTDSYVYGYDAAGQLETVTKNAVLVSQYTYDTNGNRRTKTSAAGTETYTVDDQDRLIAHNSSLITSFTYTANGELQSKTNGSQATIYQYDVIGNLRRAILPDGAQIDYVIDAQNRRVGKKVNGVLVKGWLYGNQLNPVAELDGLNSIVAIFVYASRSNVPDYMVKGGITYRIISDHLGSPRLIVNTGDGTIAQRLDYDEFGNLINDTNPGFQPFGFAGGLYDTQTKLTRFGARDYDPEPGRWTAKDPILHEGGDTNFYGYVLNDPVSLSDPFGLEVRVCRRPMNPQPPFVSETIEHPVIYLSKYKAGYGFGPKRGGAAGGLSSLMRVDGKVFPENPYDENGKVKKPFTSCEKRSDDKCLEDCLNREIMKDTQRPPKYGVGTYQCNDWVEDLISRCKKQCP